MIFKDTESYSRFCGGTAFWNNVNANIFIFAKLNTEKPTAKNVTFYLSDENITKLKKIAEKKGVST